MQPYETLQRSTIDIPVGATFSIKSVGVTSGYDGHSLRTKSYFGNQMPNIIDTVESVNSISKLFPKLRQLSKAPTFALTYQGTYMTLMTNCGFTEAEAKSIEAKYHELYKVSDEWVASKLKQASKDGYVTVAFGLRVRTPLLKQVVLGNSKTPAQAEAEGRTAGNALGQSWGLLNTRASIEFMNQVRNSVYALDIRPCAHIHDAQYYMVRNDPTVVTWLNEQLVQAVNWNSHPDIYHAQVGLGGELSIFCPTWKDELTLPNKLSEPDLISLVQTYQQSL